MLLFENLAIQWFKDFIISPNSSQPEETGKFSIPPGFI